MVDVIEHEIDWNQSGRLSTEALQGFGTFGTKEYLELVETEADAFARPSTGFSGRSVSRGEWAVREADVAEIELDHGLNSSTSAEVLLNSISSSP